MKKKWIMVVAVLLCATGFGFCVELNLSSAGETLEQGFQNPPDSAKPHTWWHMMNGNISKEGITADLEYMKQAGLGGAQVFNIGNMIPGEVTFMSKQWREHMAHAVREADRLGLELGMHNCAGWSQSGGPWVEPEDAMKKVTWSEVMVNGPLEFSGKLAQPETVMTFYRDIAVIAFPTPAGEEVSMHSLGPKITSSAPNFNAKLVVDGDKSTVTSISGLSPENPQHILIAFEQPFTAQGLSMITKNEHDLTGEIHASKDGQTFSAVGSFHIPHSKGTALYMSLMNLPFEPVTGTVFKIIFKPSSSSGESFPVAEIELLAGARIPDFAAKAGFFRPRQAPLVPKEDSLPASARIEKGSIINLTSLMKSDGSFAWNVPEGNWTIMRFGFTLTGKRNHPAPVGGQGLEVDKLSKKSLERFFYDGVMKATLDDAGSLVGKSYVATLLDSYEMGGQNWTDGLNLEFNRRFGYDILPFLPCISGRIVGDLVESERFLWDYRRLLADLHAEHYFGHFRTLAHKHGLELYIEGYGSGNFDNLQVAAKADIPMSEFWVHPTPSRHRSVKQMASVANTWGRKYHAAEAFTANPHMAGWRNHPHALKALGDLMFCEGVNRFVFHTYAHQPWDHMLPGMTMGRHGFHFGRTLTWASQAEAWLKYLSRCQYLLQQGLFVADVLYYTGEDAPYEPEWRWHLRPAPPEGYDFDHCNRDVLLRLTVENGLLILPHGVSYRVLVLPERDTMTTEVLTKIATLIKDGATVIGPPPSRSPSLSGQPDADLEIRELADEVWGGVDGIKTKSRQYGEGRILHGASLEQVFADMKLPPGAEFGGKDLNDDVNYIHRRTDNADIYFIANKSKEPVEFTAALRVSGKQPEFWDPYTGSVMPAYAYEIKSGRTFIPMQLEPSGSVFVVFREMAPASHITEVSMTQPVEKKEAEKKNAFFIPAVDSEGTVLHVFQPGEYTHKTSAGQTGKEVVSIDQPILVEGTWNLSFQRGRGAPDGIKMDKLESWTEHQDPGVKYFSGTATYTMSFSLPENAFASGRVHYLDLGDVREIAELRVNGTDFGVLWKPPFLVNATQALKPGENLIEVRVTNLWVNRLIGDEQFPEDAKFSSDNGGIAEWPQWLDDPASRPEKRRETFSTWRHWAKDDKPLASGLLGPVVIRPAHVMQLEPATPGERSAGAAKGTK